MNFGQWSLKDQPASQFASPWTDLDDVICCAHHRFFMFNDENALVIHGEADPVVPLASVMDWARPQQLPVTVVPGGGHFFHGQLPLLKSLVARHLRS